jgi:hypothetical protein
MKFKKWDKFKVDCSKIHLLASKPQGKHLVPLLETELSEVCKKYLTDRYLFDRYKASKAPSRVNPIGYVRKGVASEAEAISILSQVDGKDYSKLSGVVENRFIKGCGDVLCSTGKIIDVKVSWNSSTFAAHRKDNKLSPIYWWQAQGYMELYDVPKAEVAFVLINTPEEIYEKEVTLNLKQYVFGEINREQYEARLEAFSTTFNYSKIPLKKRVIRFEIERLPDVIPVIEARVMKVREWMNEFERSFVASKNILTSPEPYLNAINPKKGRIERNPDESH